MKTKNITQRFIFILFVILLPGLKIDAQTILSGTDGLVTDTPGTYLTLPLPANFFGPGSDPFFGVVLFQGAPLSTTPPSAVAPADVLVRRLSPGSLGACPSQATVPIEIVALHLVSCQPITVTYTGGSNPEPWNIDVSLSSNVPQQQGSMTVTKSSVSGGTFSSFLPVTPRLVFTRISPSSTVVMDPGPAIQFNSSGSPWVFGCPSCTYAIPPGVMVDHDNNGSITVAVPPSTNFYPGVSSTSNCVSTGTFSNGPVVEQAPSQGAQHTVNSPVSFEVPIPTLSQWGLIILGILFAAGGFLIMRKSS